jgi:hypothetical protein
MKQGSPQVFVPIYLPARGHEHVFRETDSSQAKVGALRPLDGRLCAEIRIEAVR